MLRMAKSATHEELLLISADVGYTLPETGTKALPDSLHLGFKTREPDGSGNTKVAVIRANVAFDSTLANIKNESFVSNRTGTIELCIMANDGITLTPVTTPSWLDDYARVWRMGSSRWVVQLAVPIVAGAMLQHASGPAGLDLDTTFRMLFQAVTNTNATPGGGVMSVTSNWPATQGIGNGFPAVDPDTWQEFSRTSTGGAGGIAIRPMDFGTTEVPSSKINLSAATGFFVHPTNHSGALVAAKSLRARVRLADWGAIADPNAPWDLEVDHNTPSPDPDRMLNQKDIPNGTANDAEGMTFSWKAPSSFIDAVNSVDPAKRKSRHQCMFVELSAASVTGTAGNTTALVFQSSSAYRNMDFVGASTFRRVATIDVTGLGGAPTDLRDVLLAVHTVNMPRNADAVLAVRQRVMSALAGYPALLGEFTTATTAPLTSDRLAAAVGSVWARLDDDARAEIQTSMPSFVVRCFRDVKSPSEPSGAARRVYTAMSSFGFHAVHDGALSGWRHALVGAEGADLRRLSENLYLLRVPADGRARIETIIQALESPSEPEIPQLPIETSWPEPRATLRGCCGWLIGLFPSLRRFCPP